MPLWVLGSVTQPFLRGAETVWPRFSWCPWPPSARHVLELGLEPEEVPHAPHVTSLCSSGQPALLCGGPISRLEEGDSGQIVHS